MSVNRPRTSMPRGGTSTDPEVGARSQWAPVSQSLRMTTPSGPRKLYPGGRSSTGRVSTDQLPNDWRSFASAYRRSDRVIASRIAPQKPMTSGQSHRPSCGGSKASSIRACWNRSSRYSAGSRASLWFNDRAGGDRPIGTSPSADCVRQGDCGAASTRQHRRGSRIFGQERSGRDDAERRCVRIR